MKQILKVILKIIFIFTPFIGASQVTISNSALGSNSEIENYRRAAYDDLYHKTFSRISAILKNESFTLQVTFKFFADGKKSNKSSGDAADQSELPGLGFSLNNTTNTKSPKAISRLGNSIEQIIFNVKLGEFASKRFSSVVKESLEETANQDFPKTKIKVKIAADPALDSTRSIKDNFELHPLNKILSFFTNKSVLNKFRRDAFILLGLLILIPSMLSTWLIFVIRRISIQLPTTAQSIVNGLQNTTFAGPSYSKGFDSLLPAIPNASDNSNNSRYLSFKQLIEENLTVATELLGLLAKSAQHKDLMVLLGYMPKSLRDSFFESINSESTSNFRNFIRTKAHEVLSDEQNLSKIVSKLNDLIFLGSQDPACIPMIVIKQSITVLSNDEISMLFKKSDREERRLILTLVPHHKIAFLVANGMIEAQDVQPFSHTSNGTINAAKFIDSINSIAKTNSNQNTEDFEWKHLVPYLPEKITKDLNLDDGNEISNERKIRNSIQSVCKWIEKKSISDSADFFATLSIDLSEEIYSNLPDIKARRIRSLKSPLSEHGLLLRYELITFLSQEIISPEQKNVA
jgi:hypothetical protein